MFLPMVDTSLNDYEILVCVLFNVLFCGFRPEATASADRHMVYMVMMNRAPRAAPHVEETPLQHVAAPGGISSMMSWVWHYC